MDDTTGRTRFSEFVREGSIDANLAAATKSEAIARLLSLLEDQKLIANKQALLEKFIEREALMTTGIGDGVAVPHIHTNELDAYHVAIGRCPQGIDFESIDQQPVALIFVIVGPERTANDHLLLISMLTRLLGRPAFLEELNRLCSAAEILGAFRREEAK